jgi:5-methylcytosine-specific restriction enzyme A
MTRQSPNLLQKIVRGVIRDLVDHASNAKSDSPQLSKIKKITTTKTNAKPKLSKEKKTRYIPASVRVSALSRDNYKCVFCGRSSKQVPLEVDHKLPFSRGGSNDLSNLQTLCFDCNRGKGARRLK